MVAEGTLCVNADVVFSAKAKAPHRNRSKPLCPKLYGAQTAGELQKALRRRGVEKNLTQCYLILCGLPCTAVPCCRPDYSDEEGRR